MASRNNNENRKNKTKIKCSFSIYSWKQNQWRQRWWWALQANCNFVVQQKRNKIVKNANRRWICAIDNEFVCAFGETPATKRTDNNRTTPQIHTHTHSNNELKSKKGIDFELRLDSSRNKWIVAVPPFRWFSQQPQLYVNVEHQSMGTALLRCASLSFRRAPFPFHEHGAHPDSI